jgi:hypothetical protein
VLIPRAAQAFDVAGELAARPEDREAVERVAAGLYNAVESKHKRRDGRLRAGSGRITR